MNKIKKGDTVYVLTGRDKGKTGNVLRVDIDKNRATVENINMLKKTKRGNPNNNTQGGIIDMEGPIHLSNLAVLNPVTNKPDRVGFKLREDGKKIRYFKSNGEQVDMID